MSRTVHCPNCGADFPETRLACPECGSDAETGWSEDALTGYTSTDIPDSFTDEDYADVIADLPGGRESPYVVKSQRRSGRRNQALVAVCLLLLFVTGFVAFPSGKLVLFFFAVWGTGALLVHGHEHWPRDRWLLAFVVSLAFLALAAAWAVGGLADAREPPPWGRPVQGLKCGLLLEEGVSSCR